MKESLKEHIQNYLNFRRCLGVKLIKDERLLKSFYDFLTRNKAVFITTALALDFACQNPSVSRPQWAARLGIIRRFSEYVKTLDLRTEIPPKKLLPYTFKRSTPFIYSDADIKDILRCSANLEYEHEMDRYSYYAFLGLIMVTGMRISEVLKLEKNSVDLNEGIITICNSKFNQSRCLSLHPSTVHVLREYRKYRDQLCQNPSIFFL